MSASGIYNAFCQGTPLPTELPESLRTWEAVLATFGDRIGHLVCYRKAPATGEWELYADPELSPDFNGVDWSVSRWAEWYTEASRQPPESIDRLYYLVDISLPNRS